MKQDHPRSIILAYLAKNRYATISELSKLLGISRPAVRFHLKVLIQSLDIEKSNLPVSLVGKGRPSLTYQLSSHEQPNNLVFLLDSLLSTLKSLQNEAEFDQLLASLADSLIGVRTIPDKMSSRLALLIQMLKSNQYFPRWEAHNNGPHIILSNCPYLSILSKHPELCRVDQIIIEKALKKSTIQTSKIDPMKTFPSVCIFEARF